MNGKGHKLAIIGLALVAAGVALILRFGVGAAPSYAADPLVNSCLLVAQPPSSSLPYLGSCELPVGSVALGFIVVGVIISFVALVRDVRFRTSAQSPH